MRKIRLYFPMKGKDTNYAASSQPPFTSPRLRNVRPYDVLERRARGGQRPGLRRMYEQILGVYADLSEYTSLQAFWRMEELDPTGGSATVKDSANSHDATPNEKLASVEGPVGRAIRFDGDSQFLDCGASNDFSLATAFTINAWMRPNTMDMEAILSWYDSATSDYVLLAQGVYAPPPGGTEPFTVTFDINGTTAVRQVYLPRTDFRMVTASYDGTDMRVYLNGSLVGDPHAYAGGFSTSADKILIGKFISGTELWLAADLCNVMLFNEALTAEQVADLYANIGSPIVAMGQITTVKA